MIQIDIELPETCGDCPMKEIYHKAYYCGLIDDFIRGYKRYQERDKRCPLREVKIGHWIKQNDDYFDWYECSECEYGSDGEMQYNNEFEVRTNYCPNCGAKMVEPQESEE